MKMKHALVGLMMGGLSFMLSNTNTNAAPGITPIEKAIRQVKRTSRYRHAFNGGLPSVKRAQRQAMARRAGRRARKLGHA